MTETFLTSDDLHYFNEGKFFRLYEKLGAHINEHGVHFAVWAPNAHYVSLIGDFNNWDKTANPLHPVKNSGIWAGIIKHAKAGQAYKYHIASLQNDYSVDKADPVAFRMEKPPATASVITNLDHQWNDREWMTNRAERQSQESPISIYEIHLGSWRRKMEEGNRAFSYIELADELIPYIKAMGFTHVEFMPVMEHPFGGSWGYQVTGFFAPTTRYGDPQGLMTLIDRLHQAEIGVILDWVPSHFPGDEHGLVYFDGTHLYEHADPRQGFHPDWNSYIFNYDRNEVRSFLISSAHFWLDKYHADALRVDAVASMLYLDYSRKSGEWIPNRYGGRENLGALQFLRELNESVYTRFPGAQMIAEESTSWPMVSRPPYAGGLGFGYKWDMGWMHDTLKYFSIDPLFRQHHQNKLTFRSLYAFHENFILSLSHDETVHGKGSLVGKMAGDEWQKFANLRCLYTYMHTLPGKKLLFMGDEFAQRDEWNHEASLDWHLLKYKPHKGIQKLITDLNHCYINEKSLHLDCDPSGFQWIDASDNTNSVIAYVRKNKEETEFILCVLNLTPVPHKNYQLGVPRAGRWQEVINSDAQEYGGSGMGNAGGMETVPYPLHGQTHCLNLTLPPLAGLILKWKT